MVVDSRKIVMNGLEAMDENQGVLSLAMFDDAEGNISAGEAIQSTR